VPFQLLITIDDTGKLDVKGALGNKLVCFGALELAKEAITNLHNAQAQRVQPATPGDVQGLDGLKVD
jgi:hypothetical protein